MSSTRRQLSSQANGRLSRGPATPESKARSSQNAVSHGLLAECVVLPGESQEGFDSFFAQHLERFGPVDGVEEALIEEMVASFPVYQPASSQPPAADPAAAPNQLNLVGQPERGNAVSRPALPVLGPARLSVHRPPNHTHRRYAKRTQSHFRTLAGAPRRFWQPASGTAAGARSLTALRFPCQRRGLY